MWKPSSIAGAFVLALVVVIALACSDDSTVVAATDDAGGGTPAVPTQDAGAPAEEETGNVEGEPVQEPQIAQVLLTVNQREIAKGKIAEAFALTPEVQAYASAMVIDYTAIDERQRALFLTVGLTPVDSSTNRRLKAESEAIIAQLGLLPRDFERIYVHAQVAAHAEVLDLIDRKLLPAVSSEELATELRLLRAAVSKHLETARSLGTLRSLH
jgi:predicted outer membrane protein